MKLSTVMKTYGATTLLAAGIFSSTPALAEDGKDYPGGLCKPFNNSINYQIGGDGSMSNNNAGTTSFFCPGINDEGSDLQGQVNVVDLHPSSDVICTLVSRSRTGQSLDFSTRRSEGISTAVQTLNFLSTVNSQPNAYLFFNCSIPPPSTNGASRIGSYEITEL